MALYTAFPSVVAPFQTPLCSPAFSIRKATIKDLDAVVDIALAAMPLDPQWNWRFPYRTQYPEDERLFTLIKFEEFLLSQDRWVVMVVEAPDQNGEFAPIAFSIWDLVNVYALAQEAHWPRAVHASTSSHKVAPRVRRDGNPERMDAWAKHTSVAKQRLFDGRYGSRYIQLQILATLPQWQRKGAASMLCSWGLQLANILRLNVTVFASPMGGKLYTHLGFKRLATVKVRAGQADNGINLAAMAFEKRNMIEMVIG